MPRWCIMRAPDGAVPEQDGDTSWLVEGRKAATSFASVRRDGHNRDRSIASAKAFPYLYDIQDSSSTASEPDLERIDTSSANEPLGLEMEVAVGDHSGTWLGEKEVSYHRGRELLSSAHMTEALKLAGQNGALEEELPARLAHHNVWRKTAALGPLLRFAARPELPGPSHLQQDLTTCASSLLAAPQGCLLQPKRFMELLDSAHLQHDLQYIHWLRTALGEASLNSDAAAAALSQTEDRHDLTSELVQTAIASWPSASATLQQSVAALVKSVLSYGNMHRLNWRAWTACLIERQEFELRNREKREALAKALREVSPALNESLEADGEGWAQLLRCFNRNPTAVLALSQRKDLSKALKEYKNLDSMAEACCADICEARGHVCRHAQAFEDAAARFLEIVSTLLAWMGSRLLPELQLFQEKKEYLREALKLAQRIRVLEEEHLNAEDEVDAAQALFRRQRRRQEAVARAAKVSLRLAEEDPPESDDKELSVRRAEKRVRILLGKLQKAKQTLKAVEASLPLAIDVESDDDENENDSAGDGCGQGRSKESLLSPQEGLARKVAELEQLHEDVAIQACEVAAERDAAMLLWTQERREQHAQEAQADLEFMCPIMHERMREPVVAADGHTYEREAIEKWMQLRNTSPMTGAILMHRYLTKNYILRGVIASYPNRV